MALVAVILHLLLLVPPCPLLFSELRKEGEEGAYEGETKSLPSLPPPPLVTARTAYADFSDV